MVGPHMPWPMMKMPLSLPKTPSSSCQITRSIGVAPRPPYSLGQCRQAQPASAFFFCQAFATSRMLAPLSWLRPSEDFFNSSSYCFGALAAIQALASVRKAASCGVSSKFIRVVLARHSGLIRASRIDPESRSYLARDSGFALRAPRNDVVLGRVPFPHPIDQRVFPVRQAAEPERGGVGAAVVHVTVEFPGETHAAMNPVSYTH